METHVFKRLSALVAGAAVALTGALSTMPQAHAYSSNDFVFTIDTSLSRDGVNEFTFSTNPEVAFEDIDCGGGIKREATLRPNTITYFDRDKLAVTHAFSCTYGAAGEYYISIAPDRLTHFGTFVGYDNDGQLLGSWAIDGNGRQGTASLITKVVQWGSAQWERMDSMFSRAYNLASVPASAPNLSKVTTMDSMFYAALLFDSLINNWDVSNVEDMSHMFDSSGFNQRLDNWDTHNVKDMCAMFANARKFNQPLESWDTSNVTDMTAMFAGAESFNSPINNWDVSKVTTMAGMFESYFDVYASSFNQPLDKWDVSNVEDMNHMFNGASSFNQNINSWNVSKVKNFGGMFSGFPGVNDFERQDSGECVPMAFNQPLDSWNVSSAKGMEGMFGCNPVFNQSLNNWDTSNVEYMNYIFFRASSFNQPLDTWDLTSLEPGVADWTTGGEQMLSDSGLSRENWDKTLASWSQQNFRTLVDGQGRTVSIAIGAEGLTYCAASVERNAMLDAAVRIEGDSLECRIDFNGNGADSGSMTAVLVKDYNNGIDLPANTFARADHTFTDWNTKADGTGATYSDLANFTSPVGDTTLYAQWARDVIPCEGNCESVKHPSNYVKVDFSADNHGSITEGESAYWVNPTKTVTVKAPKVTASSGWKFSKWDKALTGKFTKDTTITAQYVKASVTPSPTSSPKPTGSPSVKPSPTSSPTKPAPTSTPTSTPSAQPTTPASTGTPSATPTTPAPDDMCADDPSKQEKVYRLYNPGNSEHLFTTDKTEYDILPAHGWKQEGVAWVGPNSKGSSVGVYRLYNAGLGDHHYTKDPVEATKLVRDHGWVYDNGGRPLFYSEENTACTRIPVYRQYNGGLPSGQHHYTADKVEWDTLAQWHGWTKEGIGWYAISWIDPKKQ